MVRHISNVYREELGPPMISAVCTGVIAGFGLILIALCWCHYVSNKNRTICINIQKLLPLSPINGGGAFSARII